MLCFHFSAQALVLPRLRCAFTLPLRLCFHRIQERQECTSHHLLSLPAAAPSSQTLQNNTPSDVYIPCCNINVMSHRACKFSTDAAADYSCRLLLIQSAWLIWGTGKPSMLMHNTPSARSSWRRAAATHVEAKWHSPSMLIPALHQPAQQMVWGPLLWWRLHTAQASSTATDTDI